MSTNIKIGKTVSFTWMVVAVAWENKGELKIGNVWLSFSVFLS